MRLLAYILRAISKMSLQNRLKTGGTSGKNAVSIQSARPTAGKKKSPKMPENQALSSLLWSGANGDTELFEKPSNTNGF